METSGERLRVKHAGKMPYYGPKGMNTPWTMTHLATGDTGEHV